MFPIAFEGGSLIVNGKVVITRVPENIVVSPAPSGSAFIGASLPDRSSRQVFTLGSFLGFNFLALYRFKIWWMIPSYGTSAGEVPLETQMLLLEAPQESELQNETFYILVLPVLEGPFRTCLQGGSANELQFCVESGDPDVQISEVSESVYINSGENPYELIKNSIKILAAHKGTFSHVEDKKFPMHLDWFGWCTWDALYKEVNPEGIREGLESFSQGGCSPRFLIIDEGWQDSYNEFQEKGEWSPEEHPEFATRLKDIKENDRFQHMNSDDYSTFHEFIKFVKERYGLKCVYMWHALLGCWGGVLPSSEAMKKYNPKLIYPAPYPRNISDLAMDAIEIYGLGVVAPDKIGDFYSDYHSYLASVGVDGVKVDIQNLVETIGSGSGGRVQLTALYQRGLEESVAKNFKSNNLICSMSHNTDSIFSSKKSAVARASEDFMPPEPWTQTVHVASVTFNSLLLGEIVVPDWDMFQSLNETAKFHAPSKAIGGCAVYVSDKVGQHDFDILRKLVLPDGSILRARYAGRPTRDCLFKDPVMDGKSLLKIWNHNKLSGIIGVFNCQGQGTWPPKHNLSDPPTVEALSGKVSPKDVEFLKDVAGDEWGGDCAVYAFDLGSLTNIPKTGILELSLSTLNCELYTVCPITVYDEAVLSFAPIGLLDMYNSGGALEAMSSEVRAEGFIVRVKARGCGRFGAYSSKRPRYCTVDTMKLESAYNPEYGLLTIDLEGGCQLKDIEFVF